MIYYPSSGLIGEWIGELDILDGLCLDNIESAKISWGFAQQQWQVYTNMVFSQMPKSVKPGWYRTYFPHILQVSEVFLFSFFLGIAKVHTGYDPKARWIYEGQLGGRFSIFDAGSVSNYNPQYYILIYPPENGL